MAITVILTNEGSPTRTCAEVKDDGTTLFKNFFPTGWTADQIRHQLEIGVIWATDGIDPGNVTDSR